MFLIPRAPFFGMITETSALVLASDVPTCRTVPNRLVDMRARSDCFPQPQQGDLGLTRVSDLGVEHLKGLINLTVLNLYETGVTNAGLEHLKGMPEMNALFLGNTRVTDSGLEYLPELTKL